MARPLHDQCMQRATESHADMARPLHGQCMQRATESHADVARPLHDQCMQRATDQSHADVARPLHDLRSVCMFVDDLVVFCARFQCPVCLLYTSDAADE